MTHFFKCWKNRPQEPILRFEKQRKYGRVRMWFDVGKIVTFFQQSWQTKKFRNLFTLWHEGYKSYYLCLLLCSSSGLPFSLIHLCTVWYCLLASNKSSRWCFVGFKPSLACCIEDPGSHYYSLGNWLHCGSVAWLLGWTMDGAPRRSLWVISSPKHPAVSSGFTHRYR